MARKLMLVCMLAALFAMVASADVTVNYSTGGVTIQRMGWDGSQAGDFDILTVTGFSGSILVGYSPVIAPLNTTLFSVDYNCQQPSPGCGTEAGNVTRDLTINGTQSIVNPWTIHIDYSQDSLAILAGAAVYFSIGGDTLRVTPLATSFTSGIGSVNGELDGTFQLVPEPVAATVLMTMLAGLAGIAGVLKKKQS
jgi:hypothetical protein